MTNTSKNSDFIERADFLQLEELDSLSADHTFFREIRNKLFDRGTKLLEGPRGTGKTHQMRLVHLESIKDSKKPLAVYVSFNRYFHLEPLLHSAADARQIFHTWVLSRIVLACGETLEQLGLPDKSLESLLGLSRTELQEYTAHAEKGLAPIDRSDIIKKITIPATIDALNKTIELARRSRAVLLLDDAALTLTPDYLIEFFDIVPALKSTKISPKVSVYPGTTQYGPRFHVRHDAEFVSAWLDTTDEAYDSIMEEVYQRRKPATSSKSTPDDIVEIFKYASFGVPRVFLAMVRSYERLAEGNLQARFNKVIGEHSSLLFAEFESLKVKLPQLKKVIALGVKFQRKVISDITAENGNEKSTLIGLQNDEDLRKPLVERMIKMLQEVGMLYQLTSVSHGPQRDYERYIPHTALLLQAGAFRSTRGFAPKDVVNKLKSTTAKHPVRRKVSTLLGIEEINNLALDLPLCQNCSTERLSEAQKFCHNCGEALVSHSTFRECMTIPIDDLPLTSWQKRSIEQGTDFRTIGDIYSKQDPVTELRKIRQVGPKRSQNIVENVEKYVDEFLS